MIKEAEYNGANSRIDTLRRCIDDENYLHAAVQRLALVLSRELIEINRIKDTPLRKAAHLGCAEAGNYDRRKERK